MESLKITPCLWFDNQAEEAVFYVSILKIQNGKHKQYLKEGFEIHGRKGSVLTVEFQINGQAFLL
jgi:predicted 3-demethylubiquinone-9 3-methyltransferase (glyoxalase superfamily)